MCVPSSGCFIIDQAYLSQLVENLKKKNFYINIINIDVDIKFHKGMTMI